MPASGFPGRELTGLEPETVCAGLYPACLARHMEKDHHNNFIVSRLCLHCMDGCTEHVNLARLLSFIIRQSPQRHVHVYTLYQTRDLSALSLYPRVSPPSPSLWLRIMFFIRNYYYRYLDCHPQLSISTTSFFLSG